MPLLAYSFQSLLDDGCVRLSDVFTTDVGRCRDYAHQKLETALNRFMIEYEDRLKDFILSGQLHCIVILQG
jgi:hypothetical protein